MQSPDEMLALAFRHHQAGNLALAEPLYRQVLQTNPNHADAWHLLGEIEYRLGRYQPALDYIGRAICLTPDAPAFHCNLGLVYHALGRLAEAVASYERALQLRPGFALVHNNLGLSLKEQGRTPEAIASYRQALRFQPNYAAAHNNLGGALAELGKTDEAIACYRESLRVEPAYAEAYNNLGNALAQQKRFDEALASLQEAIRLKPGDSSAHSNMGNVLRSMGRLDDALAAYRTAIALRPGSALAYNNLAAVLHDQGKSSEALAGYEQALRLKPAYAEAHVNLAHLLRSQGRCHEAIQHLGQALRLRPDSAGAHVSLGDCFFDRGNMEEARAHYERALGLRPTPQLRIIVATLLPLIYDSLSHVRAERQRLIEAVDGLRRGGVQLDVAETTAATPFYLAYQGLDDRDLRVALGRLHTVPEGPPLKRPAAAGGKIKVGFISAYFREHTIGRLMQGLIARLPRDIFHVTALSGAAVSDQVTDAVRAGCDCFLTVPSHLPAARRLIAEQRLDLLFYTDIGMDPVTSTLAFSRLAPVQCVTWGHPETTGLESIDYYVSSELFEAPEADRHYSETLVRLKTLPAFAYRPAPTSPLKGRDWYGLPADAHLYGCLQNPIKLHPDFDALLAGILRRDPKGMLILTQGFYPHWHEALRKRFQVSMPDVVSRIKFVGWLDYAAFLNLNAVCDVFLDPVHFGGGRTSYDALGLGQPIVTYPSQFQKGRMTLAMYRKMQVMDCVAARPEEYIDIAVKLGTEPDYRSAVVSKIRAANSVLYEDQEAVRELGEFFEHAVASFVQKMQGR